jgi:hypothetical protein
MRARTPVVQGSSSQPPVAQGRPSTALLHFANALGLPDTVPGDGDWLRQIDAQAAEAKAPLLGRR